MRSSRSLAEGDLVSLGDGGVSLEVLVVEAMKSSPASASGGGLMGRPGVNVPSSRLQLATPTPEDLDRIAALAAEGVEAVAVSFVRRSEDIDAVRDTLGHSATMLVREDRDS